MKVVITGVAGHLGSNLARHIVETIPTAEVVGLDNFSTGYLENIPDGVRFAPMCNLEEGCPDEVFEGADYVYHMAAYAAEGLSPFVRRYNYQNNLVATAGVVNACIQHKVKRLVFTSSMAVYGVGNAPFDEVDRTEPIDPYGNAKLAAERDIRIAAMQHDLEFCIIRPHNVYGPGQDMWQPYRNVLAIWMARALCGKSIRVYGTGEQTRAFSYIADVLPCLWQSAVSGLARNRTINLGGSYPRSILTMARIVSDMTGAPIEYKEPRHEVSEAWCTTARSEQFLGWQDITPIDTGLQRMWDWAKEAWDAYPSRRAYRQPFDIEMDRGLYSFWK